MDKFTELGGTIWVCVDCLMADANGEMPADPDPTEPEPWALWDGLGRTHIVAPGMMREDHYDDCDPDDECGCERQDFSWQHCDGCGSRLGGSREAYTFWSVPTAGVRISCRDSRCHGHYVVAPSTRLISCDGCGDEVQRMDLEPNLDPGERIITDEQGNLTIGEVI